MAWGFLTKILSGGVGELASSVGRGVGSVMDRLGFVEKMSEAAKMDYTIELIKATNETDKLDAEDLKSAREMAMIQMKTQKASWLVRQMNGALRPFAGWVALVYLTEKMWGQLLTQYVEAFTWIAIPRDPIVDFAMTGILAFFFGFRQRAKEKSVTNMQ
jgi:hypothetical protein